MAEFIMKKLVCEKGLSHKFEISSSATSTEEIFMGVGNPIYPPAAAELTKRGVPFTKRQATQLKRDDYGCYDLFIGMDSANIRNMNRILKGDPEGKIHKLKDYSGSGGDVSDPWYSDRFDIAFADIHEGCRALLDQLTK